MLITVVTAVNQTGAGVFLSDLGTTVPASGSLVLTDLFKPSEYLGSNSLFSAVALDQVLLDLGDGVLTKDQSLGVLSKAPLAEGTAFDDTLSGLGAKNVQEAIDTTIASIPARFDAYDATANLQYTSSLVSIGIDTVRTNIGGAFTLLGGGQIRVDKTSSYELQFEAVLGILTGTDRSNSEAYWYLDGVEIPGTRAPVYNRDNQEGQGVATCRVFADLTAGQVLEVRCRRFSGASTCATFLSSRVTLMECKGAPGANGADGVQGPPGPAGSGSNINVANGGVVLPGGPYSLLNMTGGMQGTNAGGGQVDLTSFAAGTTFPASPADGQPFYRTDLQWDFRYDASRGKWLGTTVEFEGGGLNGTATAYLRRFNGMTTSATLGTRIPYDITIVGFSAQWGANASGTWEVMRSGTAVYSQPFTTTNFLADMSANADFAAGGVMAIRVIGSVATPQTRVWYRRRAS